MNFLNSAIRSFTGISFIRYEISQYPFHAASISLRSFASCAEICSPPPPTGDEPTAGDSETGELGDALLAALLLTALDDEAADDEADDTAEDVVIDLLLTLDDTELDVDAELDDPALDDPTPDDSALDDSAALLTLDGSGGG